MKNCISTLYLIYRFSKRLDNYRDLGGFKYKYLIGEWENPK